MGFRELMLTHTKYYRRAAWAIGLSNGKGGNPFLFDPDARFPRKGKSELGYPDQHPRVNAYIILCNIRRLVAIASFLTISSTF